MTEGLGPLVARLTACADDPMWADHAEVPMELLRKAAQALEEAEAVAGHYMAQRDAERERCARICEKRANFEPENTAITLHVVAEVLRGA